jgi:hypothetical protein
VEFEGRGKRPNNYLEKGTTAENKAASTNRLLSACATKI